VCSWYKGIFFSLQSCRHKDSIYFVNILKLFWSVQVKTVVIQTNFILYSKQITLFLRILFRKQAVDIWIYCLLWIFRSKKWSWSGRTYKLYSQVWALTFVYTIVYTMMPWNSITVPYLFEYDTNYFIGWVESGHLI